MSEIDEQEEDVFHQRVMAAFRSGSMIPTINPYIHVTLCPLCGRPIEIVERRQRVTFAGPEPDCIQYQCDHCGISGDERIVSGGRGSR